MSTKPTADPKLAYLDGYEQAIQHGEIGSYLRSNGIYSSQIAEWRKLRDAGILDENSTTITGQSSRSAKSKISKEQAEIAQLKRQLAAPRWPATLVRNDSQQDQWTRLVQHHRTNSPPLRKQRFLKR